MTTPPSLPSVPGLAWSRHKSPKFNTRIASHASGREVRVALQQYALYEFEATYSGLASQGSLVNGLGSSTLESLMGLFLQSQGQFGTFLYTDPDDNTITGQGIGTGDGATTDFLMVRALGGFVEPVGWVTSISQVRVNGTPTSVTTITPNTIRFASAPASSAAIVADFSWAFVCRFLEDDMDFEEFMSKLWRLDSMKFRSVKPPTVAA